ncbi:MAG: heavy metal-binding domain-containing protein [Ignavibacteriae bacterium]|nr:heavy metal-binding domain-containing protein [Ignavibacteriota bacterium]MCB9214287.1 heavy metal-binding domain-containing protein [Ignavibacteria bacterium]
MIITNTATVPGKEVVEVLEVVYGNTVQAKHLGKDIMAGFKSLVGGEIVGYSEMLTEARERATQRMVNAAESVGADAVVNVRYTTSAIMQGMSEVLAYGTAVKLR